MRVCSGAGVDCVQRRITCIGGDLAGGGPDTKRGWQLPRHMPHGGGVEGGNGDFKSPLHRFHHLP